MITKFILVAIIAACGVQHGHETSPNVQLGGDPDENAKAAAAARAWHERQLQMQMQTYSAATNPDEPDKLAPDEDAPTDQHFCCVDVDLKNFTGDGCNAISGALETINACANLLYCPGKYAKKDGHVVCE